MKEGIAQSAPDFRLQLRIVFSIFGLHIFVELMPQSTRGV